MFRLSDQPFPRLVMSSWRGLTLAIGGVILLAGPVAYTPAHAGTPSIQPSIVVPQGVPSGSGVATQVIYIVPVSPPTPGIRRAPVAEPVIYLIEQDEPEGASVRAVR
jgi:hypothetical protein